MPAFIHRLAEPEDAPAIAALMERAMTVLQLAYLTPEQINASRASMGLDAQLITDRSYIVVEEDGALIGCGGWSRRATLYGGSRSAVRDDAFLDPARDAARIRAMYTDPAHIRRGVGRLILSVGERLAREAGFHRAELMATLAGEQLYLACGYRPIERVVFDGEGGPAVPSVRMGKDLR